MAKQTMDNQRDSKTDSDPEMVVSVDKRLVAGLGVLVLVGLVGLGTFMAMRGGTAGPVARTGTGAGTGGSGLDVAAAATAEARKQGMIGAGIDPNKVGSVAEVKNITAVPQDLPPSVQTAQAGGAGGTELERPPGAPDACNWPHEVLQNFPDPNVDNAKYSPERIETVVGTLKGPRLAIGDLNDLFSYDYGVVVGDEVAGHDFRIKNVGDEDLLISRVYTGCGCTATKIKDTVLDAAGFVKPTALKLVPGEETTFTVEYDPRVEASSPCRARHKFVQIFSNDTTKTIFDPAQENQHETRFRIVIEPRYGYTKDQIATQEAVAAATQAANKNKGSKSP